MMSRTTTTLIWARLDRADQLREPALGKLPEGGIPSLEDARDSSGAPLGTAGTTLKLRRRRLRHVTDLAQTGIVPLSWTWVRPDCASRASARIALYWAAYAPDLVGSHPPAPGNAGILTER